MTEIVLQLRYTPRPQRAVCAQFISSPDPASWLDELGQWHVPLESLRFYPLSRSHSDNSCVGVLVSLEDAGVPEPGRESPQRSRSQAYGRLGKRLFVPVEAELSVLLRDEDWQRLFGNGSTEYVWHPQTGLVVFERDEILTVHDLLSPHVPGEAALDPVVDWGRALPGVHFPNRISSVRADLPASAADMLENGRDGIGTQAKQLQDLPRPWSENVKSWGQSIVGYAIWPLAMVAGLISRLIPNNNPRPAEPWGWSESVVIALCVAVIMVALRVGSVTNFSVVGVMVSLGLMLLTMLVMAGLGAVLPGLSLSMPTPRSAGSMSSSGAFAGWGAGLQAQMARFVKWTTGLLDSRRREIERLKKLLDEDPDEGLKYALPVGGGDPARGMATPSGALTQRHVDFRLGGQGGSALADYWELSPETQFDLVRRYRELAAREVQLGRYRRAAYIFAELLGDLNSAATTLVNGRFYREAAVLYRDRLHRPQDAARCLEQGGLLIEAISIYRQLAQHEKVGDLYRRLGDDEQAELAYQDAIGMVMAKRDFLDAARLYQEKLRNSDRALETLDAGWPDSQQAKLCLAETFSLLGRQGLHHEVVLRIQALLGWPLPASRVVDAVGVLAAVSTDSPHAQTRAVAADTVRRLASRELLRGTDARQQLTAAVGRLAPEDRLLARDCQRAMSLTPVKRSEAISHSTRRTAPMMRLIKTFELPAGVTWCSATGTDRNFYIIGQRLNEVIVARGAWNDPRATVSTVTWNAAGDASKVLMGHSMSDRQLFLGSTGGDPFARRDFSSTDSNPDLEVALTPAWMPQSISALVASGGHIYVFQLLEQLLTGFTSHGAPTTCETLQIPLHDLTLDPDARFPMVSRDNAVYLGVGPYLIESQPRTAPQLREMSERITSLAISHPNIGPRLAVIGERSGEVFWSGLGAGRSQRFEVGLANPLAVILRNRNLVIHGTGGWQIYSTHDDTVQCLHDLKCDLNHESIGLLRPDTPNQVGLCTTDGRVRVFELP